MVVNGQRQNHITVSDRGLHYGDGLFETIALIDGTPHHWDLHLQRLAEGCRRLGILCPGADLLAGDLKLLDGTAGRQVLKIIVTRGSGGRGYRPPGEVTASRILTLHPWPDYPPGHSRAGIVVRLCRTRLGRNDSLAGVKHLNRLEQVLARSEWDNPDIAEGLMLDSDGLLIEGTMSNIFLVRDDEIHTPALTHSGVAGIIRERVLRACRRLGITVSIRAIAWDEVHAADEIFVTNSLIGIWPVRALAAPSARTFATPRFGTRLREFLLSEGAIVSDA